MPDLFSPPHVREVAWFLLEDGEESGDPDRWRDVEDARCRSAESRAYYSVLLALREVLENNGWRFPRGGSTNQLARESIDEVLSPKHPLSDLFKRLWRYRTKADYDLGQGYPVQVATDRVIDSGNAAAHVADLDPDELSMLRAVIDRRAAEERARRLRSGR